MKINVYKNISRKESPKWKGWKILDFYSDFCVDNEIKDERILKILDTLVDNFNLINKLK